MRGGGDLLGRRARPATRDRGGEQHHQAQNTRTSACSHERAVVSWLLAEWRQATELLGSVPRSERGNDRPQVVKLCVVYSA
jgi:hypothetical protein